MQTFRAGSRYSGVLDLLLHGGIAVFFALVVALFCGLCGYFVYLAGWAPEADWPAVAIIPAFVLTGLDVLFMMWHIRVTPNEIRFFRLAGSRRIRYEEIEIIQPGSVRDLYLSGWFLFYLGSSERCLIKFVTIKGKTVYFPLAQQEAFRKILDEYGYPHALDGRSDPCPTPPTDRPQRRAQESGSIAIKPQGG